MVFNNMATLTMTIIQITEADYDGVNETVKKITGDIDGGILPVVFIEETTVVDATVKTNYKNKLTDLGYTWDIEA